MVITHKDVIQFYYINEEYIKYLRKYDSKVSLKDTRSFIGIKIKLSDKDYCIPLTSQVTPKGGNKRNSQVTTFVKDFKDEKIACLLHNNMIPVYDDVLISINFDEKENKDYFIQEYVFIKNNFEKIKEKANKVYEKYMNKHDFFAQLCCDFKLLEEKCNEYINAKLDKEEVATTIEVNDGQAVDKKEEK